MYRCIYTYGLLGKHIGACLLSGLAFPAFSKTSSGSATKKWVEIDSDVFLPYNLNA